MLLFTASGTGAFESAVANLTSPGDRALVVSSGSFGERWAAMVAGYGAELVHLKLEWGATPEPADLRDALEEAGGAKVVYLVHSETSTGVVADIQALTAVAKEAGALVVVDAVSSLGAVPLETDAWGDRRRRLRLAEGADDAARALARVRLAGRARRGRRVDDAALLLRLGADARRRSTSSTRRSRRRCRSSPASTSRSACCSTRASRRAFERHVRLGRACREGAKAMGLELFSPDEDRSAVVTAIRAPEGIDAKDVVRLLRDRFGITIANGQGALMGKIFRLGHIGWFDVFDIATQLGGGGARARRARGRDRARRRGHPRARDVRRPRPRCEGPRPRDDRRRGRRAAALEVRRRRRDGRRPRGADRRLRRRS